MIPTPASHPFPLYIRTLVGAMPARVALTLGLTVAVGLTEGVGLLVLVPMLHQIGLDVQQGSVGQVARVVAAGFSLIRVPQTLATVLAVYVLIIVVHALLYRWQTISNVTLQHRFASHLRQEIYRAVTHASWLCLSRTRSSDLTHAMTMQIERVSAGTNSLLRVVSDGTVVAVYLTLTLYVSPVVTALVVTAGAALTLMLRPRTRAAVRLGRDLARLGNELYAAVVEHLGAMKTAKSYGAVDRNVRIFSELCERGAAMSIRTTTSQADVKCRFDIGGVLILGILLYVAIALLAAPTAGILLLLFCFARVMPRVSNVQQFYQQCLNMLQEFALILAIQAHCARYVEARPERARPAQLRRGIRLEGVEFAYEAEGALPALTGLDLTIRAGETTAVVGPSGAGKSTIADLVLGVITPDRGRVLVDGAPLAADQMAAWRNQIGYVAQETFLFHDTVRANLLWARPEAPEAELAEALRTAAAAEFVDRLPQGMDTILGDRGVRLSGGERQRLALARAVLRRPALLILDEATSSLDSESERRVQDAIDRLHGRLTILVITHRLSTIRMADVIYVLEGGRVVETGTWDSLITVDKGRFHALCVAQGLDA